MHDGFCIRPSQLFDRFERVFPRTGNRFGWIGRRIIQVVRQWHVARESRPYTGTSIDVPARHRNLIIF